MKGSGIMKDMRCSEELQEIVKEKKMSRGKVVKALWKYIKRKGLQNKKDKRIVECDDRLTAIFGKVSGKKRELVMRGKKIKLQAGQLFMTEMGKPLNKHLS